MTSPNGTNIIATHISTSLTDATGAVWTAVVSAQGSDQLYPMRNGTRSQTFGHGRELRMCNGKVYIINGAWAAELTASGFVYTGMTDAPCPALVPLPPPPIPRGMVMITALVEGAIIERLYQSKIVAIEDGGLTGEMKVQTITAYTPPVNPTPVPVPTPTPTPTPVPVPGNPLGNTTREGTVNI